MPQLSRVLISGGGTGGHIFPAIAIADEIRRRNPAAEILFVGALERMEMDKVPAAGYNIIGLPIKGIQRSFTLKNLSVPFMALRSVLRVRKAIRDFEPQIAIGVGGYASGPSLLACRMLGIPYIIQEQNSFAGLTNKWLAKGAKAICVAWPAMDRYFPADKIVFTGNPVRQGFGLALHDVDIALRHFGLSRAKPVLFVTGGSLGALTINSAIAASAKLFAEAGIQVIWQTGKRFARDAEKLIYQGQIKGIYTNAFIDRMDLAYACADAVVARAGALTISELALVQKPAILVPSPNVAEDHQTHNAKSLVSRQAAILVRDAQAADMLFGTAQALLKNQAQKQTMSSEIAKIATPQATADIVNQLEAHAKA